jgi:serine protease Do
MFTQGPGAPRRRAGGYIVLTGLVVAALVVGFMAGTFAIPPVFRSAPQPVAQAAVPSGAAQSAAAPTASSADPLGMTPGERDIIDVVRKVQPSVVNINTRTHVQTFFGVFPAQGAGSGVIVRPDGYILTNNHVVAGATRIQVSLLGGKTYPARVVGTDPLADLAVIKVNAPTPLPAAQLGSSQALQVGQLAIAIGNPFALGSTVTTGVVSALNRNVQGPNVIIENLIQTSAAINPGNSGGALVDSSGQVIGINTAIIPNAQGIGFAIPSDVARVEMDQLIATGHVAHPWVGVVYGGTVNAQVEAAYNLGTDHGVAVRQVEPGSPAAQAGVQAGDIITAVNGDRIESWDQFVRDIVQQKIGARVTLTIVRNGATHQVTVTLGQRPVPTSLDNLASGPAA